MITVLCISNGKSHLISLELLPLMMEFELSDLSFFIKSIKFPGHFDIHQYSCSSKLHHKLAHRFSTRQATSGAGCVAALAVVGKEAKYSYLPTTYQFQPVAIETTSGAVGPSTRVFLKDLGRRVRREAGEVMATPYLFQRISVAVQRGNTAAIMGCARQL